MKLRNILLAGLLTLPVISSAMTIAEKDYNITYSNFAYGYFNSKKDCELLDDRTALSLYKAYKDKTLIIDGDIIKWDVGNVFTQAIMEIEGKVYNFQFFTTLKMCQTFRDILKEEILKK